MSLFLILLIFDKIRKGKVIKVSPKTTKEELKALLDANVGVKPKNREHFGKLKGVFGDGLAYQKRMRADEE